MQNQVQEPAADAEWGTRAELWKFFLAGALLLFITAVVILTIQTPGWPVQLFGGAVHTGASAAQSAPSGSAGAELALSYTVNPMPVFDADTLEGNVELYNDEENAYSLRVRYVREETGETIYESAVLAPGDEVKTAVLAQPLSEGEWPVTAQLDVLDSEGKVLSQVQQAVTLTVAAAQPTP